MKMMTMLIVAGILFIVECAFAEGPSVNMATVTDVREVFRVI